jgi:hypothetical protein
MGYHNLVVEPPIIIDMFFFFNHGMWQGKFATGTPHNEHFFFAASPSKVYVNY